MAEIFSIDQMKELMRCVRDNNIGELLLETEGTKLRIRGAVAKPPRVAVPASIPMAESPQLAATPTESLPADITAERQDDAVYITSPLVGTFYPASGPDKDPFIKVGQMVKKGDTVFIVESMKVMNEIQSECDGIVDEILLESGAPVEYGQPIVKLCRE